MHSQGFSDLHPFKKLFFYCVTWGNLKGPINCKLAYLYLYEILCCTLRDLAEGLYILYFIHNKKDILEK